MLKKSFRNFNRGLILLLVAIVITCIALIIISVKQGNNNKNVVEKVGQSAINNIPSSPALTAPATTDSSRASPRKYNNVNPPTPKNLPPQKGKNRQEAVNAAATIMQQVTKAMFDSSDQMRADLTPLVAPTFLERYLDQYSQAGELTAKGLGYSSADEAATYISLLITTQQYRIDSFSADRATVSLYDFYYFQGRQISPQDTVDYYGFQPYGIDILKLERINGSWMLVGIQQPVPGVDEPVFTNNDLNLTSVQINQRFQPYLKGKGYRPYVYSSQTLGGGQSG